MDARRLRTWKLSKPAFSRHYDIRPDSDSSPVAFVVDISVFTPGKPNLTLHRGASLTSNPPIVACVHTPKASRSFTLGLGDPSSPNIQWDDVTRQGATRFEFSFPTVLPGESDKPLQLTWKKTKRESVQGMKASGFSSQDFKLVDGADRVLAVFTHERGIGKCGTLEIRGSWGEAFDLKVLMTVVTLYDLIRRRQNAAAGGGGGGAGGSG